MDSKNHPFQILYSSDTDWGIEGGSPFIPSVALMVKPKPVSEVRKIPLVVAIDLGEIPDLKSQREIKENTPLFHQLCQEEGGMGSCECEWTGQNFPLPPILRRQIAVCEFEQPFLKRTEKAARWLNYRHYLEKALKSLTTFLRCSAQVKIQFELTLIFVKKVDDRVYCWTPLQRKKMTVRSRCLSHLVAYAVYSKMEDTNIGFTLSRAKTTNVAVQLELGNFNFEGQPKFVISRLSKPMTFTDKWFQYIPDFPHTISVLSEAARDLLPVISKVLSVVVNVRTPSDLEIRHTDTCMIGDRVRGSMMIILKKKNVRPTDTLYLHFRVREMKSKVVLLKHFSILASVVSDGRLVERLPMFLKTVQQDRWLTNMVHFLTDQLVSMRKLKYRPFPSRACEASMLNCNISGTDLSLWSRHKAMKGVEFNLIWKILQVKGLAMITLCDMANVLLN
jgi:hypothetical protein